MITQLLCGKGKSSDPVFFLVQVCSWRSTKLLLIEHGAGYLQVRQVIQTSLYLCKAGAIIPILQVSKLSFREFKHLFSVTQTGKWQSLHLNTSKSSGPKSSVLLCHLSGHGKINLEIRKKSLCYSELYGLIVQNGN